MRLLLCFLSCGCYAWIGNTERCTGDDWNEIREVLSGQDLASISDSQLTHWTDIVLDAVDLKLLECPEGAVTVLFNALPRIHGIAHGVPLLQRIYHRLRDIVPEVDTGDVWMQHWLGTVKSFVNFVYSKWVQIPTDIEEAEQEAVSLPKANLRDFQDYLFRTSVNDFLRQGVHDLAIAEGSVTFREAFAFTCFCKVHNVQLVAESGVYKGFSSELWSLFVKQVIALDLFPSQEIWDIAADRLQRRTNVQMVQGNGHELLELLPRVAPGVTTAVFIDGPKGEVAIRLALELRTLPQVAFVAVHDVEPYRAELQRLGAFFFSDEDWFQSQYAYLDSPFRFRSDLAVGGLMAFLK